MRIKEFKMKKKFKKSKSNGMMRFQLNVKAKGT